MKRLNEDTVNELHSKLRESGSKIRGLGFLVSLQQGDPMPLEPAEEVYEGIGMILDTLGRELLEIASKIDEDWLTSSSSTVTDDAHDATSNDEEEHDDE